MKQNINEKHILYVLLKSFKSLILTILWGLYLIKLQGTTLSDQNHRNTNGHKRKQTQGVGYESKLTCCGFFIQKNLRATDKLISIA